MSELESSQVPYYRDEMLQFLREKSIFIAKDTWIKSFNVAFIGMARVQAILYNSDALKTILQFSVESFLPKDASETQHQQVRICQVPDIVSLETLQSMKNGILK
jgi:hypothetical protein